MKSSFLLPGFSARLFLSGYRLICQKILLVCFAAITVLNLQAGIIIRTDFNRERVWLKDYRANEKWVDVSALSSPAGLVSKVEWGKVGTIDVANTYTPSEALFLKFVNEKAVKNWSTGIHSGLLPAANKETNLGKLSFSFDNWVSSVRPVLVRIESYDAEKKRTGGLEKMVYPATANHFLRSGFELSDMKAFGSGKFNPTDPFVNFSFSISDTETVEAAPDGNYELRIDNVMYASPAYYVSPAGNDANDGRSEKTAFANPQKALDLAKPGDIILLMDGKYTGAEKAIAVANFKHPGYPSAWITLKNYPGHRPTLLAHGKEGVRIQMGGDSASKESPLLSYIEVRGLHIRGNADQADKLFASELGISTRNTEAKGINICGAGGPTRMYHHFRIADNIVEYCGGYGVFTHTADYMIIENNILRNNCYTTVDLCSAGFACMMYADFDKADNITKILVRNNQSYGNMRKTIKREGGPKIFNGDGMLFDANCEAYIAPDFYLGRTLIQNNLVYGNGGGGIQNWGSHRLDIVNNTIYYNGLTPELKWGNIGLDYCKDVRIINNIIVAQDDRPLDSWMVNRPDKEAYNITRINNLYFGGVKPNVKGEGDIIADPLFVNPSLDPAKADFRLKPGSPAVNSGANLSRDVPVYDLSWLNRKSVDRGAFEVK